MGLRRLSDPGWAVKPGRITPLCALLTGFIGYPVHGAIEERLTGAVHTAEFAVIAGFDRFKMPVQELLLYSLLLYSLLLYSLLLSSFLLCSLPLCLLSLQSLSFFPFPFLSLSLCSLYIKHLRINY